MRKHNILFIIDTLEPGGLSHVTGNLIELFNNQNDNTGLAILSNKISLPIPQAKWVATNNQNRNPFRLFNYFIRYKLREFIKTSIHEFEKKNGHADLIIVTSELAHRCLKGINHPNLIISIHGSQIGSQKNSKLLSKARFKLKTFRRATRLRSQLDQKNVHVVSSGLAKEITETFSATPKNIYTILNPFDIEKIRNLALQETAESASQTNPFIVGVGRLCKEKGFSCLLTAFSKSQFKGDLLLIGQGEEKDNLLEQANKLGIGNRFKIIPFHKNHYALVAKAKLLLLTSKNEGLPSVLIESLILGIPAISLDCPHGPYDILAPINKDALIPPDEPHLLPSRIDQFIENPYPIPEELVQRFSAKVILKQYLAMSQSVQKNKTP